jgi:hypothetical protein
MRGCEIPYSRKQVKTARAIAHGWKPSGSAVGMSKGFAQDLLEEDERLKKRKRTAVRKLGKGAKPAPRGR